MDSELGVANALRPADGTVPLRQPDTTAKYHVYLFVLAVFGLVHTSFVLDLFIYLYSLYLCLIVLALFIKLGSPHKPYSRSVIEHCYYGNV